MLVSISTLVFTLVSVDFVKLTEPGGFSVNSVERYAGNCPQRPRGWKQIFSEKRCKKSCTSDADCRKRHKQCLCDGECGFSCISPTSRCHALLDVPNGYIRTPQDFVFDSVAEYGCDSGFTLIGPSSRRCQGNREWSGIQPKCRPKAKCGPPPQIPYANHDSGEGQQEFDLETMLHYSCISGYYRYNAKGLPKAKCMLYNGTAQWFGPDLKCSARSCGHPGELLNGLKEGDLYEYPHIVKYQCVYGFELFGSAIRKCQAKGQWSGERPICKPIQCSRPTNPTNGDVLGTSLAYQSKVRYICRDGYRLVGQVQRICQADGTWSGLEPTCEEIRCPEVGPLWNGYIEGDKMQFNDILVFRCLEAMTRVGPSFARCKEDGTWSHPLPKCYAPCPVPKIERGHVRRWNASQLVLHGERIQVECLSNHEPELPEYALCHNGTWSIIPRCVPFRCKEWPPKVPNAVVVFAKTNHNSMARYQCNAGFVLKGDAIIRCLFGRWTTPLPNCEPKLCPNPKDVPTMGSIANGKVLLEGKTGLGTYEYAEYIRSVTEGRHIIYECDKGFTLIGPPRATCVDGHWRPSVAPTCVSQKHPLIQVTKLLPGVSARLYCPTNMDRISFAFKAVRYEIYFIEGSFVTISNFLIFLTILRYKKLRNRKEYLLIAGLCLADCLNGAGTAGIGHHRLTINNQTLVTPEHCFFLPPMQVLIHSSMAQALMLLLISVDRFLSISRPLQYMEYGKRYVYGLLAVGFMAPFGKWLAGWLAVINKSDVLVSDSCYFPSAMPANVYEITFSIQVILAFLAVIFYFLVLVVYREKLSQVVDANTGEQNRLTISLGISGVFTFILYVIPYGMMLVAPHLTVGNVGIIAVIMANINPLVNVFIYLKRHENIRKGFSKFICCQSNFNEVAPSVADVAVTVYYSTKGERKPVIQKLVVPQNEVDATTSKFKKYGKAVVTTSHA